MLDIVSRNALLAYMKPFTDKYLDWCCSVCCLQVVKSKREWILQSSQSVPVL